ncbi:MAG: GTPase Era [Sulfuricurvum sp. PC08-66]|nr:MAG: GTPase Era [Sulfuricurvum sp. PC08-66]
MQETKAGFVALVGRPNAGKSTLMNWLLGESITMVSHKANATRKRINAIVMHHDDQIIFVDTPGLHKQEKLLNQFMLQEALKAIGDADLVLFLSPVNDGVKFYKEFLALNTKNRPHMVLLTKMDQYSQEKLFKTMQEFTTFQDKFLALIPISSTKNIGAQALLDEIVKHLPTSPHLYDPEDLTTEHLRDIYREFIREAIFENISDEIPYECDVLIQKVEELSNLERITATIIVEKDSQKGMIIGQGGAAIKRIGKGSREKIERLIQKKVYLDLMVSVKKGWTRDKKALQELGYDL